MPQESEINSKTTEVQGSKNSVNIEQILPNEDVLTEDEEIDMKVALVVTINFHKFYLKYRRCF